MGSLSRVPLAHSLSCPDAATDPSLAVSPLGRVVPPCASQGLHFDSTVKVYCVSSRPNFLQVRSVVCSVRTCGVRTVCVRDGIEYPSGVCGDNVCL